MESARNSEASPLRSGTNEKEKTPQIIWYTGVILKEKNPLKKARKRALEHPKIL